MRNMTLGKLDSASFYPVSKYEARKAAEQMNRKFYIRKRHFVYGHARFHSNNEEIGTYYYLPVSFTRRQYNRLADFQRDEYDSGVSNYNIYAVHR
jgi:hypothetical protein